MSQRPLRRSRSNRMIAGVVGGLSEYFNIDPTLGRVVFVLAAIITGAVPFTIAYIIFWLIIPEE